MHERHPDFIVIGPDLGVVVLEVKDWRRETLVAVTADGVVLNGDHGEYVARHPVHQARDYILKTVDLMKRSSALRAGNGLCCGWGYAAVLTSFRAAGVREASLFGPSLEDALGAGLVLTADDLATDTLLPRLRALVPAWSARKPPLTPGQMDQIRAALHPEIRVGWARRVTVMDREQERLACSIGPGHRVLRGVAGSGKTIALVARARYLAEVHPTWRILVLCYNRPLAEFLTHAIGHDRIDVVTFHAWCSRELRRVGLTVPPPPERREEWAEYWEEMPRRLLQAHDRGAPEAGTYQAMLVDEGQDFADDWYRIMLKVLDPRTNSLFIALDSSQNIYKRRGSWRDVGVRAVGYRTRVLRTNYRNTRQILAAAYAIIRELDSTSSTKTRALEDEYVVPDRAVRNGPPPDVHRHASREVTQRFVLDWITTRLTRGIRADNMLLLRLGRLDIVNLSAELNRHGLPAALLGADMPAGSVRLSTIHSAKGFDAAHVLIIGGHELDKRDDEERRRLLYIAMTRARDELTVFYQGDSPLMAELEAAIAAVHDGGPP